MIQYFECFSLVVFVIPITKVRGSLVILNSYRRWIGVWRALLLPRGNVEIIARKKLTFGLCLSKIEKIEFPH